MKKEPEDPIRAELFSIERLEQHAESLALAQGTLPKGTRGKRLIPRVKENARMLMRGYRATTQAIQEDRDITPAAEWLVDNFHIVEEQIREIIDDLPPGFYRGLPKLADGPFAKTPRVYGIAWAFVAHTDSRFDAEWLRRFVMAYQHIDYLTIGEIWALAISIRIVLVENLRRLTERILLARKARWEADALADALLGLKKRAPKDPMSLLTLFENEPLQRPFAVQLVQRLRDQGESVEGVLQWLNARLETQGTTAENIVRIEHQEQAAINATVRNIITSMRHITALDWSQFFEDVSMVDEVLRTQADAPAGGFPAMDFPTRDRYRHAIEELARGCDLSEVEVAKRVVQLAQRTRRVHTSEQKLDSVEIDRQSDPGYYLISRGRAQFEREINFQVSFKAWLWRFISKRATPLYLGCLLGVTGATLYIPISLSNYGEMNFWMMVALTFLSIIPASDLAVALVNSVVTDSVEPKPVPKLDFSKGIPKQYKTLVVIPTLLTALRDVDEYIQRLEIHHLSNPQDNLQFALLTDWADAANEHSPQDEMLLEKAREGIRELNKRYQQSPLNLTPRFFIFHRRRVWNEQEGVWMGWERKRGKLEELNRLLRGELNTTFMGLAEMPQGIHYVVTLDADTQTTRGAAVRLVGAMAHPLNRPVFDTKRKRIVEGYGIMQPRITPTLPTAGTGSQFQKIYSGPSGIDPYAFAISDVYQDLFKEGSFIGKGIYDVDAFNQTLQERVPDNTILSHDLFEGIHARTALVTDIEFFEEFPSHYEVSVSRNHRWVRGDWQLLPWIFKPNKAFSLIDRWKMIDNLRRSLSSPFALAALFLQWFSKEPYGIVWLGFIFLTVAIPPLLPIFLALLPRRRPITIRGHIKAMRKDLDLAITQIFLAFVFLAHHAWVMIDAIARTVYRLFVSHKHMLEWTTAAVSKKLVNNSALSFYRRQKGALLVVMSLSAAVVFHRYPNHPYTLFPFLAFWLLCPWIAQQISLPVRGDKTKPLSETDRSYLRRIARKTWRFFETFVTSDHHFLPPDNFQEIPEPVVARRTSPTNIGLYLLTTIAAHDFGWIGLFDMVDRIENTLNTVKRLARYNGHLYNWYDTWDMRPLDPLYISTVDSGNLAGHLWTLSHACEKLTRTPLLQSEIARGLIDVFELIKESVNTDILYDHRSGTATRSQLHETMLSLELTIHNMPATFSEMSLYLEELKDRAATLLDIARALAGISEADSRKEILKWSQILMDQIDSHMRDFKTKAESGEIPMNLKERLLDASSICQLLVEQMQFGFLFEPTKKLFSIGYQVNEQKLDQSYYDLLASEARLASFIAIAKGDVPSTHWFHLSRSFRVAGDGLALISWSGSMFEYLMPQLVMRTPLNSILEQTNRAVVQRQIEYGREHKVPWGVSESAYNAQNLEFTYQYSNFGVPGLGLKRDLARDLVIAPYATGLATMIFPRKATKNFRALRKTGAEGIYGFYEAVDYTHTRLPEGQKSAIVKTYMAHHQAMALVSITNVLHDGIMRERFHSEPMVLATELLLQERTPREVPISRMQVEIEAEVRHIVPMVWRRFSSPHDVLPRTHLLSNGHYSVMITAAGSGYSKAGQLAVTRWREDVTRDNWGTYIYLRDVQSGQIWSAGYQPVCVEPEKYEVDFSEDRAEIVRRDESFITTLEVVVSSEDNAEIRRVTLKNVGYETREVDITSYAEVVLASQAADQAHPAFSNLFVQTEFVSEVNGLICTRRQRSPDEPTHWMAHVVVVEGETVGDIQYESDRAQFLGRGRDIRTPICIHDGRPLSNSAGAVLDPIVSLRRRVRIHPGQIVRIAFTTLVAASYHEAMGLADKYHDPAMFERTVTLAWTHAHVQQHHLGMALAEAHLFQDLASRIIYSQKGLRPSPDVLKRNNRPVTSLWAHGISGDIPIVLVRIDEADDRGIVRELLRAHEYWRMKNLSVDLVILNERAPSYIQDLQGALENLVRTTQASLRHESHGPHGKIFIIRLDQLSAEDHVALRTAARVTLLSRHGTLAQQVERLEGAPESYVASPTRQRQRDTSSLIRFQPDRPRLQFFNGLGGFSEDGKEYVIILAPHQWTPLPWINVISNPTFGFHVSESGSGSTWSVNSRENQLTPWSNDPVRDPAGEVIYLRDEATGDIWTPTILPIREETSVYTSRHGHGYSRFEHSSHDISSELTQFVHPTEPVKISRLKLTNRSRQTKRLSIIGYTEWVLGTSRSGSAPFIISELEENTEAILTRNPWNPEFAERVAFMDMAGMQRSWTGDRMEFIGRNGTLARPRALESGIALSNEVNTGTDVCAALQTSVEIKPGATAEVVVFLGQGENRNAAVELIERLRKTNLAELFQQVQKQWETNLSAVQVSTPDKSMNLLLNGWLLYQTLVCRLWSRAAFYQAGGAYGFRDQLQDIMALAVSRRDLAREHILRTAARQFPEGDVQHWWHPPSGRGVRTKISDDLVWLPFVVNYYLEVTGDKSILDEQIPFLVPEAIPEGREDIYYQPAVSKETASLYEHCARTLDRSLPVGSHGLPLMGTGDWNDGMNRVGHEGKGESIWLAWFLHSALWEFAKLAQMRGEEQRAIRWRLHVGALKTAVEHQAWDGEWYLRAFFDNGKPLGSALNTECKIDSIAQSWGVLSGAADPARAAKAMASVKEHLIRRNEGMVLIFTPPFNQTQPNPGYIQGYLPGVRENGGQYTHAAIWTMMAFAALGDGNMAGDIFSMLNPISHGKSRTEIDRYKIEPFVMAGDVYAEPPHTGRGGWSWYTGSAGWMYRAGVESILGFRLRDAVVYIDPCIPSSWPSFQVSFRYHSSRYEIRVENPNGVCRGIQSSQMDGKSMRVKEGIPLVDDGNEHRIDVVMG